MSSNTIHIEQGRIGRDPDLKVGKTGTAFLTLSVCTSDSWFNKNKNEWVNESNWMDVKFFGKIAEEIADKARKGDEVYLRGHLKLETWDGPGGKGSKLVVIPDLGHVRIVPQQAKDDRPPSSRGQSRSGRSDDGNYANYGEDPNDDSRVPF